MISKMNLCLIIFVLTLYIHACIAQECQLNESKKDKMSKTITVDRQGNGDFKWIQEAIDSIPSGNTQWIRIFIYHGVYMEKIYIPKDKGCIFIEGQKTKKLFTAIVWGAHDDATDATPTLTIYSDNIVLKGLVVKNTYGLNHGWKIKPAVAARLLGDKYAIHRCEFVGLQDTLWDGSGRHYFKECHIYGVTDFIWGQGQSIYESCHLDVTLDKTKGQKKYGYITAQGRESSEDSNGYVFKWCKITVNGGEELLGRAYRPYSRVIFYQCQLPKTIAAAGWHAWNSEGREGTITYVEKENTGEGANTGGRVPWMKEMSDEELSHFISLSYIDQDGWIAKLPPRSID